MRRGGTRVDKSIGMDGFAIRERNNNRNEEMRMIMRENDMGMKGKFRSMRGDGDPFTIGSLGKG
jgi:hypothetical protein